MTRLIITTLLLAVTSGCFVHDAYPGRRSQTVYVAERQCHPSQYWDGSQCRHKGKGWGARKHDGR